LSILSSALTGVFWATGAPGWWTATWFLIFDLGLKIAIIVVVWTLFQRRPRADRLEYRPRGTSRRRARPELRNGPHGRRRSSLMTWASSCANLTLHGRAG